MNSHLLHHLSALAVRRAIIMREEAQLWDILSRDLKREAGRLEDIPSPRPVARPAPEPPTESTKASKLYVGIAEAARMMGIGRSKLYAEIAASRIRVRKSGRRVLIAVSDIEAWFSALPEQDPAAR